MSIQLLRKSRIGLAGILFILGTAPGIVGAQVVAEVEGTIESITPMSAITIIRVMGIDVEVPNDLFIDTGIPGGEVITMVSTPTAKLTSPNQLLGDPLPGRTDAVTGLPLAGFLGGTAIITGVSKPGAGVPDSSTGAMSLATGFVAQNVFVEPAENVVIGSITSVAPGTNGASCDIYIEGTHAVFSTDPRMPASPAVNGFGFEVDACTVALGGAAAVEGYYGSDGKLHIFAFESDDAVAVRGTDVTTITRATCDRGKVEVRGSSTLYSGTAVISDADNLASELGSTTMITDVVTGNSIYRFRNDVGSCPQNVHVETSDGIHSSFAVAPVDIK